ncbi:MAG: hypothetical protein ACHP84_00795 [Caulobacterales bacterium]
MSALSGARTHFVLAYSGCDQSVGEAALESAGPNGLVASNNGYDWLGTGVYFWESDPDRALQWAEEARDRHAKRYRERGTPIRVRRPFVVGALINLSNCLDLTTTEGVKLVREGHKGFMADMKQVKSEDANFTIPSNTTDRDMKGRYLDFAVINYTCQQYVKNNKVPIDTVRCVFAEGNDVYEGAGFQEKTHTQICVREPSRAILAFFRVPNP